MKRLLLLVHCFLGMAGMGKAQNYSYDTYPITYGVTGGLSAGTIRVTSPYQSSVNTGIKVLPSIGVYADYRFNENISIRPGLMLAGKGGKVNANYSLADNTVITAQNNYKLYYVQIPLAFIARIPVGLDNASFFFGGGPFAGYGISGNNKQTVGNVTQTYKVKYGAGNDFYKADYGATTVLGFQASSGFSLALNGDFGFKNILLTNNTGFDATAYKTWAFYFSVGKTF